MLRARRLVGETVASSERMEHRSGSGAQGCVRAEGCGMGTHDRPLGEHL